MPGILLLLLRILIAAALYAFLGWALWLLYRDLRQRSGSLAAPPVPPLVLTQLEPALSEAMMAEMPASGGLAAPEALPVFRISVAEAILGRDPACQIYIDNPTISARHARLAYHHAQWWVEDLHSRNGVLLNDLPVEDAVVLTQDDELRCGALTFTISFE